MMAGARPVFADIDPDRFTIDPRATAAAVTSNTAAIMPVHLYGQSADMTALMEVASRHNLAVVEDCCQAHLATCAGKPVGTFGAMGAFSFYPTKNLGALGDAGAIVTSDPALAARAARLRNGGQTAKYRHDEFGVNSRLDEMQAAILRARLAFLPAWTAERRTIAGQYRNALRGITTIAVPPERDAGHVYHLFPIRSRARDAMQAHLKRAGIETLIHYPIALPLQPAFADQRPAECPIAVEACAQVLSLPLHPGLAASTISDVARALADGPA
jgi:dTDP-3-amino-3,4,6-trideoxy-alpha-D-glucose transaminase